MKQFVIIFLGIIAVCLIVFIFLVGLMLFIEWDLSALEMVNRDLNNFTWLKFRQLFIGVAFMTAFIQLFYNSLK